MSNQSGILANQALLDELNKDLANAGVVTARISSDSTAVELDSTYATVEDCVKALSDEPLYIFYHAPATAEYQFISYVPDTSAVRSKMLYASTKNTLVRQIGTNSIGKQLLITEASELADFANNLANDNGTDNDALTESERSAREIDATQKREFHSTYNSISGRQLVSQTGGGPNVLQFDVKMSDNVKLLLKETNVVSFKIDLSNEDISVLNKENISNPEDLKLSSEHPTYTLYRNNELYYFIYSCPSGSKVKERMLYASNKSGFIKHLNEKEGIEFSNVIEIGDADELELSLISSGTTQQLQSEASKSDSNSTRKFNRPRGPGGRKR